jgi:queuine/archaeosine tRNA-ribosyltransferase
MMEEIREAIRNKRYKEYKKQKLEGFVRSED